MQTSTQPKVRNTLPAPQRPSVDITPPNAGRLITALRQLGYSLEQALADLIDNSINARASTVLIRFITEADRVHSILVADDGIGMTENVLKDAMRFGSAQKSDPLSLGKYGMGLKLASFSHARALSVLSRRDGVSFGRRWTVQGNRGGWECDVLSANHVSEKMAVTRGGLESALGGTMVLWDDIDRLPVSSRGLRATLRDLQRRLQTHLGLSFHRFIERQQLKILLDQQVYGQPEHGIRIEIRPLDPFAYHRSGSPKYPKAFSINVEGVGQIEAVAHVWPPNSEAEEYRLEHKAAARQGFYFYRNERLIQAGGWNGLLQHETEPHNSLARVCIDLPPRLDASFGLNVQKSAVVPPPGFIAAIGEARSEDGAAFDSFRRTAQLVYRCQDYRAEKKYPLVPAAGLPKRLQETAREILSPGDDRVRTANFRWENFAGEDLFQIERESMTIKLNEKYRNQLLAGLSPGRTDLPMLKLLIFPLVEPDLAVERVTVSRRRRVERINRLLSEAAGFGKG